MMANRLVRKRMILYAVGAGVVLLVVVGIYLLMNYFEKPVQSRKQVQQISIIQPPPPPPPPEEPPPPPEVEEEVEIPEPEEIPEELPEAADEPPAGDLGLDADGGAGADGFGLVGRKGGRGLLAGGGSDPATRFASTLKRQIEDVLSEYDEVRSRNYKVVVTFRISNTGQLSPGLESSTGDPVLDSKLKEALQRIASSSGTPPSEVLGNTLRFRIRV